MSRVIAKGYVHRPGFHCASSAIRNLVGHFGHALSEPMCLGLGLVCNFMYAKEDAASPTRMLIGRNIALEEDFFRIVHVDAPMRRATPEDDGWPRLKAILDEGHPVMIQVDLFHLKYFNSSTHFGGHKVLLAGYDLEKEVALISDSEFPEMQWVTLDDLHAARFDPTPPFSLSGQWWELHEIPRLRPLKDAVDQSLRESAERVFRDPTGFFGIAAMRRCAEDLPHWTDQADWAWCARFAYQIIERRGTGGGYFRTQYANFLSEAATYDPDIDRWGLPEKMREIGTQWTELAYLFKDVSERPAPGDGFARAAEKFAAITDREEAFFRIVAENWPSEES
ncbi:MAG: BtrH N-terminal domain-containing protein [Deltaproteobacteria bacterium]|nr:BtrH N-terminal domain-containing protein [Deltaproteobacteria bacterium]